MNNYAFRATRGGGWFDDDAASLAARARFKVAQSEQYGALGFRCVRVEFSSSGRVRRGGGRSYGAASCRAAYRFVYGPDNRVFVIGLRCVRREE